MGNGVNNFALAVDDLARAEKFYRETFDWKIIQVPGVPEEVSPPIEQGGPELRREVRRIIPTELDEHGFPIDPGNVTGVMMQRTEQVRRPFIVIEVDNIDETLDRVTKSGGKTLLGRGTFGELGFTAYFTDTEGNVCCLWESPVPGVRIGAPPVN